MQYVKSDLKDLLSTTNEIDLTVRGRKSGQDISRPVWFVHEDDKLYLLPVRQSSYVAPIICLTFILSTPSS